MTPFAANHTGKPHWVALLRQLGRVSFRFTAQTNFLIFLLYYTKKFKQVQEFLLKK
jgi:hypothetical protein